MDRASGIFVMAGDEVGVIAHISKVPAGAGVNVATISAAFMGNEVTVILTRDCYDHARAC